MDGERAQHAVADGDGIGGHPAQPAALQRRQVDEPPIDGELGPEDRLAVLHHPADRALADREIVVQLGRQLDVAERQRPAQALAAGVVGPDADVRGVEELRDGPGQVLEHFLDVQRGGHQPVDLFERAQPLGVPAGLLVEAGVADGRRRLGREGLQQVVVVAVEAERPVADHHQHAQQLLLVEHRRGEQRAEAALARPLARHEAAVGEHVVDGQRPALDRDPADRALAEAQVAGILAAAERGVGVRLHVQRAGRLVGQPEGHERRAHDLAGRLGDRREHVAGVQRRRHQVVEPGQRAQAGRPRLGRLVEARVLHRDGGLGGEALQQGQVLGLEAIAAGGAGHDDDAAHLLADDERLHDGVLHAVGDELRVRQRRVRIVVGDDPAPLTGGHPDQALPRRQPHDARPLGGPRPAHEQAALVDQVDRALGVEQPPRALDDQAQQALGIELGGELALDLGQRGDLAAPRALQREEPGVLQRQRGLVGERLEQVRLLVGEGAAAVIAEGERADDHALDPQRHRQDGAVTRAAQPLAQIVGDVDAGVVEDVGAPDRARLDDRPAEQALAGGQHVAGLEAFAARPAQRQGHQRAIGLREPQHGGPRGEQRDDALDGVAHHVADVEALGERLGQPRQLLGLVPAPRGLGVQARVVEGQRGLVGEGLQQLRLRGAEGAAGAIGDGQRADRLALGAQRHRQMGDVTEGRQAGAHVRGDDERGIVLDVAGGDGGAALDRAAGGRRAGRQHVTGHERLLGAAGERQADQRPVRAEQAEAGGLRGEQRQHALGDPGAYRVDVEALGEAAHHPRQLLGLALAPRRGARSRARARPGRRRPGPAACPRRRRRGRCGRRAPAHRTAGPAP